MAGKPAAIASPIIGSFGQSMVLIWDAKTGVLTQVGGENMDLREVTRVAEALQ